MSSGLIKNHRQRRQLLLLPLLLPALQNLVKATKHVNTLDVLWVLSVGEQSYF